MAAAAEWRKVQGKGQTPGDFALGKHLDGPTAKSHLVGDFAKLKERFLDVSGKTPKWVSFFAGKEPPTYDPIPITMLRHATSVPALEAMYNGANPPDQLEMEAKTSKTNLHVVWFGAVGDIETNKEKLKSTIYEELCEHFKMQTENNIPTLKASLSHGIDDRDLGPFFASPAFSMDYSRYGDVGISVGYKDLMEAYLISRGYQAAQLKKLRFKTFLTHAFEREVEHAVLVCVAGDEGKIEVEVNDGKGGQQTVEVGNIGDLPKFEGAKAESAEWAVRSTTETTNAFAVKLEGSKFTVENHTKSHKWSWAWEALNFAFYFPDPEGKLILPIKKCDFQRLCRDVIFLGAQKQPTKQQIGNVLAKALPNANSVQFDSHED